MTPKKQDSQSEKSAAINDAIFEIAKEYKDEYGAEVIQRAGILADKPMLWWSTGVLGFDLTLGGGEVLGGIPRGRIIEVHGAAKHGKTSFVLQAISGCQKAQGECVYVDAERKMSLPWAQKNGVNVKDLVLINPPFGEAAIDATEKMILAGADMVVLDSMAALVPRAELEGQSGESFMGVQPRLISQAMRKLNNACAQSGAALVCINHVGANLSKWGGETTIKGGKEVIYYSSIIIEIKKKADLKERDDKVGIRSILTAKENQIAIPYESVEFNIYTGKNGHRPGIDVQDDLLELGIAAGVVVKAGTDFSFGTEKIAKGHDAACDVLFANPKLSEAIRAGILKAREGKVA
jgi:recombination protein RecA